eukprot:CAMPEP_0117663070 /NCGR_PEP_ID=MMETSP0804-20121206/8388_1 /TAXON_ID=1074897 /ORGANISM="Tetraselmis astigmatica, Strain CCMP880" /LENGTH=1263 /DNA_ID=CAMNT_0005470007 /DNA_START=319 /DNA_END=4111 /DNA_ORIENTATION=-
MVASRVQRSTARRKLRKGSSSSGGGAVMPVLRAALCFLLLLACGKVETAPAALASRNGRKALSLGNSPGDEGGGAGTATHAAAAVQAAGSKPPRPPAGRRQAVAEARNGGRNAARPSDAGPADSTLPERRAFEDDSEDDSSDEHSGSYDSEDEDWRDDLVDRWEGDDEVVALNPCWRDLNVLLEYEHAGKLGWTDASTEDEWWRGGVECIRGSVVSLDFLSRAILPPLLGPLPVEWSQLTELVDVKAYSNSIRGSLPPQYSVLQNLVSLELIEQSLTGSLPPQYSALSSLETLNVVYNILTGALPPEYSVLTRLTEVSLSGNNLSGSLPRQYSAVISLSSLDISNSLLTGSLPPEFSTLKAMKVLSFTWSGLTGTLPPEYSELTRVSELLLDGNYIRGTLPPEYSKLQWLTQLSVPENHLSGPLPPEYSALFRLEVLSTDENTLNSPLPPQYSSLQYLVEAGFAGNWIPGTLPPEWSSLGNLDLLHLADNDLTGTLPVEWSALDSMFSLELALNYLTGTIPEEWGEGMESLSWIYLDERLVPDNCAQQVLAFLTSNTVAEGCVFPPNVISLEPDDNVDMGRGGDGEVMFGWILTTFIQIREAEVMARSAQLRVLNSPVWDELGVIGGLSPSGQMLSRIVYEDMGVAANLTNGRLRLTGAEEVGGDMGKGGRLALEVVLQAPLTVAEETMGSLLEALETQPRLLFDDLYHTGYEIMDITANLRVSDAVNGRENQDDGIDDMGIKDDEEGKKTVLAPTMAPDDDDTVLMVIAGTVVGIVCLLTGGYILYIRSKYKRSNDVKPFVSSASSIELGKGTDGLLSSVLLKSKMQNLPMDRGGTRSAAAAPMYSGSLLPSLQGKRVRTMPTGLEFDDSAKSVRNQGIPMGPARESGLQVMTQLVMKSVWQKLGLHKPAGGRRGPSADEGGPEVVANAMEVPSLVAVVIAVHLQCARQLLLLLALRRERAPQQQQQQPVPWEIYPGTALELEGYDSKVQQATSSSHEPSTSGIDLRVDFSKELKGRLGRCLGSGAFGQVYQANWRGMEVAVKLFTIRRDTGVSDQMNSFKAELQTMAKLTQSFMHPALVHRDLKPQNILLDSQGRAKICDLGLSRHKDPMQSYLVTSAGGTPYYMAPEVFTVQKIHDKADIYALAVILNECISRKPPWEMEVPFQVIYAVSIQNKRPAISPDCPEPLRKLITKCWAADAHRRPSAPELLRLLDILIGEELQRQGTSGLLSPERILCAYHAGKRRSLAELWVALLPQSIKPY